MPYINSKTSIQNHSWEGRRAKMIHGSKVQTREKIQDTQQKQSGSSIRPISMKISWTLNKVTYKKNRVFATY